jgi:hypothetical protein
MTPTMNPFCRSLLFVVCSIPVHSIGQPQWTLMSGNVQLGGTAIVKVGDTLLNAGQLTLHRSPDLGNYYEDIAMNVTGTILHPRGMVYDGDYLHLATDDEIYRSPDLGETWQDMNCGLPLTGLNEVARMKHLNGHLFVVLEDDVGDGGGIYRSADQGDNWTNCSTSIPGNNRMKDIISANGLLYAASSQRVFSSSDNGSTWTETYEAEFFVDMYSLGHDGNNRLFFTGDSGYEIAFSDDGGLSFIPAATPAGVTGWFTDAFYNLGGVLFAFTDQSSLLYSTNNGISWASAEPPNQWIDVYGGYSDYDTLFVVARTTNSETRLFATFAPNVGVNEEPTITNWSALHHDDQLTLVGDLPDESLIVHVSDALGRTAAQARTSAGNILPVPNLASGLHVVSLYTASGTRGLGSKAFLVR